MSAGVDEGACPGNAALLALFAGNDAPAEQAALLRQHLPACSGCRRALAELREARDWLRSSLTPTVDAALVTELRRRVALRIARRRPLPWFLALLARVWAEGRYFWRPSFDHVGWQSLRGFGVAALLLVGAVGGLSNLDGRFADPGVWVGSGRAPLAGSGGAEIVRSRPAEPTEPDDSSAADEEETAEGDVLDDVEGGFDDLPPSPGDLRIEMGTPDPNVRIIWFASIGTEIPGRGH